MYEDIPLIYGSLRIMRALSLIYKDNWIRYACIVPTTTLVLTQFNYMFFTDEGLDARMRNSYCFVLWFNTLIRAYLLIRNGKDYESLIANIVEHYDELLRSKDAYIQSLLTGVNNVGIIMARGNLFLGMLTCIGFGCYPIFASEKVLPFGSLIPGINVYESPYYEALYVYHMVITPFGCCMYIPYTSLIVAFIMFGIVMCKTLQHRLRMLKNTKISDAAINAEIIECIKYQRHIISYISRVNSLTMFIFSLEFLAFGALLCALLFLLIIANTSAQAVIVCAYITMIFAQILALYWYANELRQQSLGIADAAYDTEWFTFPKYIQKHIILLIVRAQRPCALMIGNTYPMTLELFQSLLNASYSYFTLLKRVYN